MSQLPHVMSLPAVIDTVYCCDLHTRLHSQPFTGTPHIIDASHVERINSIGIQFLLSYLNTHKAQGRIVTIQNACSAFTSTIDDLGLTAVFAFFFSDKEAVV